MIRRPTVMSRIFLVLVLAVTAGPFARAEGPVVADVQVVTSGPDTWILRIRSSEPQAFDVLPQESAARYVVRLHGARPTPARAALDATPFGAVRLDANEHGVDVRIDVVDPTYSVRATQGTSPSIVEVRIRAADAPR
jgi:hypothetical protein